MGLIWGMSGKSTSESSESELTTATALFDFFLELLPLPVPLPFTCVFCTDFVLGLTVLGATGIHEGKCADLDSCSRSTSSGC